MSKQCQWMIKLEGFPFSLLFILVGNTSYEHFYFIFLKDLAKNVLISLHFATLPQNKNVCTEKDAEVSRALFSVTACVIAWNVHTEPSAVAVF